MKQKADDFLAGDSNETESSDVQLVVDKAQEGELQIEQMQDTNAYDANIDQTGDKPWLRPGADITDYFNYGFTEGTWQKYCEMQKDRRAFAVKYKDICKQPVNQEKRYEPMHEHSRYQDDRNHQRYSNQSYNSQNLDGNRPKNDYVNRNQTYHNQYTRQENTGYRPRNEHDNRNHAYHQQNKQGHDGYKPNSEYDIRDQGIHNQHNRQENSVYRPRNDYDSREHDRCYQQNRQESPGFRPKNDYEVRQERDVPGKTYRPNNKKNYNNKY